MTSSNQKKGILCLPGKDFSIECIKLSLFFAISLNFDLVLGNFVETSSSVNKELRVGRKRSLSVDAILPKLHQQRFAHRVLPTQDQNEFTLLPKLKLLKKILKRVLEKESDLLPQISTSIRVIEKHGEFADLLEKSIAECEMVIMANGQSDFAPMKLVSSQNNTRKLVIVPPGPAIGEDFEEFERSVSLSGLLNIISKVVFADEFKEYKVQSSIIRDLMSNYVDPINHFKRKYDMGNQRNQSITSLQSSRLKPLSITFYHVCDGTSDTFENVKQNFTKAIRETMGTYRNYDIVVEFDKEGHFSKKILEFQKGFDLLVMVRRFRGTDERFYWEVRSSITENLIQEDQDVKVPPIFIYRC